jgi:hypothetical protein
MKMNRIFGLALLVMTAAAGAAHAEVQAKVHLPFAAHWGKVIMAPGDYNISLPEASLGHRQLTVEGGGKTGYIQPLVTDDDDKSTGGEKRSYLEFVKVNGTYFVAQYRSAASGKIFRFAVPKQQRHVELSDQDVVRLGVAGN